MQFLVNPLSGFSNEFRVDGQSGARKYPLSSEADRKRSSDGHGRSGFTKSAVTGDTPPQSSIPASRRIAKSSERLGGA